MLPVFRDGSVVAWLRAANWRESATAVVGDREWVFAKSKGELTGRWITEPEAAVLSCLELVDAQPAPLRLRAGAHTGDVVVTRDDVIGHTVNIAARVQGLADPTAILATKGVVETPGVADLLAERGYHTQSRESALRGVSEALTVYEIREAA